MTAFSVPANLAFDDYNGLVDAISDWMNRSDLSGSVQSMIALAEARMRRVLEPHFSETGATVAVSSGVGSLPADFSTLICVRDDDRTLPQISSLTAADVPDGSDAKFYTLEANVLKVWPAVDVNLSIIYRPTLPQLSSTSSTNGILSRFPDMYFFGAMMFAEGYVANDSRAGMFKALFDEALEECRRFLIAQSFSGPLVPRFGYVP